MPRGPAASGGYSTLPDSPSTSGASQSQQRQQGQPPPVPPAAAAAAASATTTAGAATARSNAYGILPVAEPTEQDNFVDHQQAGTAQSSSPAATAGEAKKKRHVGGGEKDKAAAPAAAAAAADLTGGLPTTEGVYVGSPVTPQQPIQQHTMPRMPRTVAPHTGATVLHAPGGGDGNGMIDVGLSQPPYNPDAMATVGAAGTAMMDAGQHTVIVVNTANSGAPWEMWGRSPQQFVCPACSFSGYSRAIQDPCSPAPLLAAACCCLVGLWPCSFIPFLVPDMRDTVHRCPNCNLTVGRSRQCF